MHQKYPEEFPTLSTQGDKATSPHEGEIHDTLSLLRKILLSFSFK
jgi:hypothetical protein